MRRSEHKPMLEENELVIVKEAIEEFLQKMTIADVEVRVVAKEDGVEANIKLQEPQFLIGSQGQTLSDLGRLMSIITTKKLKKNFHLKVDINEYRKKKIEYLKNLAKDMADEVAFTKEKKILEPMSAYERMVIHTELAQRQDVVTESWGDGADRHIVINPK